MNRPTSSVLTRPILPLRVFVFVFVVIFVLLTLILDHDEVGVEAAHARKRVTGNNNNRSNKNNNKYDKQITTFDPSGQLLQVTYAHESTKRGRTCVFVKLQENVIMAVVVAKYQYNEVEGECEYQGRRWSSGSGSGSGMHRIHDGIMAKMTGLEGDARLLARHLQSVAHNLAWTEGVITDNNNNANFLHVDQIAKLCGEVQHSLTIRNGARPLGVDCVLMGKTTTATSASTSTNDNNNHLGLFQCAVGGTVNHCEFCASGKDSASLMKDLDSLLVQLKKNQNNNPNNHEDDINTVDVDVNGEPIATESSSSSSSSPQSRMKIYIERIAQLVIQQCNKTSKHTLTMPQRHYDNDGEKDGEHDNKRGDTPTPTVAVDIYIMASNIRCRGGVQISYAASVTEDQLSRVATLFVSDMNSLPESK